MLRQSAEVKLETKNDIITAYVLGEIDHRGAVGIRCAIDDAVNTCTAKHLILDLSGVDFMDSSGLGLILGRYNNAKKCGLDFSVVNPSRSADRILSAAGANRIIKIIRQEN